MGGWTESMSHLPLAAGRRIRPHPGASLGPCATPPPTPPLPCPSVRWKCERRPQRGSRRLWGCPLLRVRFALHPTTAPPAPIIPVPRPGRQIPPRPFGLAGSSWYPMRGRGFLCRGRQPCRDRLDRKVRVPVGGLATTLMSSLFPSRRHYSSRACLEPIFTQL